MKNKLFKIFIIIFFNSIYYRSLVRFFRTFLFINLGNSMSKMNNNGESENSELNKEYEAYKTLKDWVKTVPKTMKELEKNGETDKLIKYKNEFFIKIRFF